MAQPINPTSDQQVLLAQNFFNKDGVGRPELFKLIYELALPILSQTTEFSRAFNFHKVVEKGGTYQFSHTRRGKAFPDRGPSNMTANTKLVRGGYKTQISLGSIIQIPDLIIDIDYDNTPNITGMEVLAQVLADKDRVVGALLEECLATTLTKIAIDQDADLPNYSPALLPSKYNLGGSRVEELTDTDLAAATTAEVLPIIREKFMKPINDMILQSHDFARGGAFKSKSDWVLYMDRDVQPFFAGIGLFELSMNPKAREDFEGGDWLAQPSGYFQGIPTYLIADKLPIDANGRKVQMILAHKEAGGLVSLAPKASFDKYVGYHAYISNLQAGFGFGGCRNYLVKIWVSDTAFNLETCDFVELSKTELDGTAIDHYDFITKQIQTNVDHTNLPLAYEAIAEASYITGLRVTDVGTTTATAEYVLSLGNATSVDVEYLVSGGSWTAAGTHTSGGNKTIALSTLTTGTAYVLSVRTTNNEVKAQSTSFKTL